jgi:hypothetical protein
MRTDERHVFTVERVHIDLLECEPPQLWLRADGTTMTPGYSAPRLRPRVHAEPPADGILEFDFVASPPDDDVRLANTPVRAAYRLDGAPEWLRGARVHAEVNRRSALMPALQVVDLASRREPPPEPARLESRAGGARRSAR